MRIDGEPNVCPPDAPKTEEERRAAWDAFDDKLRLFGTTEGRLGRKLTHREQCAFLAAMLRDPPVPQRVVQRAAHVNAATITLLRNCLPRKWRDGRVKRPNGRYPAVVHEYETLGHDRFMVKYSYQQDDILERLSAAWDDVRAGKPAQDPHDGINRRARTKCGTHRIRSWKFGTVITAEIALRPDGYRYRLEGLNPDESMIWQGQYSSIPGPPFATSGQAYKDVLMRLDPAPSSDDMNWEPSK